MTCYTNDEDEERPEVRSPETAAERGGRNRDVSAELAEAFDGGVDAIDMMIGAFLSTTPGKVRDTSSDDETLPPRSLV